MTIERVFDFISFANEKYGDKIAVAGKKNGRWKEFSFSDYQRNADYASAALLSAGIKKGDHILNISDNRPEWNFADIGILQIGAVHVPVFPTINEVELEYIIKEINPSMIFLSNRFVAKRVKKILNADDNIRVIALDDSAESEKFSDFLKIGEANYSSDIIAQAKSQVTSKDLASIIYTSGTTTMPKGVMLSHMNHVSNVIVAADLIGIDHTMSRVCYLPLSHSYERMVGYISSYRGMTVYYNENMVNILSNFQKVKPSVITSVPLLLEKIYKGVIDKSADLKGVSKLIYKLALKNALLTPEDKQSVIHKILFPIYDKLVYHKWVDLMGGKVEKIICGGAALSRDIYYFFRNIGVPVYDGYGLTEMAPLVSFNNMAFDKPGTVGRILPNIICKLDKDGEILLKGANMMMGYYKHSEITEQVIDADGWLHTGDIGVLDDDDFLSITGRKKTIFKTSSGTYVYPERIENQMKLSSFVDQVIVIGENRDSLGAIITLDKEYIKKWIKRNSIEGSPESVISHNLLRKEMDAIVMKYNAKARETHQILQYEVLLDEWTIDTGELTPSMKIKRKVIETRYTETIKALFK